MTIFESPSPVGVGDGHAYEQASRGLLETSLLCRWGVTEMPTSSLAGFWALGKLSAASE